MVCLIIPPSSFLLDDKVFMSLGILKVASVLEKAGIPVEVLDLSGIPNFEEATIQYANSHVVSHFGITATTPQMPSAFKITEILKGKGKIILGGPHVTLVNAALKKGSLRAVHPMEKLKETFDILVCGDGEEAIFRALQGERFVDADDRKSDMFLSHLEDYPYPARHLIEPLSYHYQIDGIRALSLIAQLGCPFGCGFCGGRSSAMLRNVRTRSSQAVVKEMVSIYETYGIKGFMFHDDELNVNPNMVELMSLIVKTQKDLGVEWRLRGFIKAQLFTELQAQVMYAAGFRWILVGFEAANERILSNINKRSTLEENTKCLRVAQKAGLKVKALMSIGHPGETEKTIEDVRSWLLKERPDDFDVTIITCYPGTPYFDEALPCDGGYVYTCKSGDKLYQYDVDHSQVADYYKGIPGVGYHSYVYTDALSAERLVDLRDDVELDVRKKLDIPFPSVPARLYDHSMGQ